MISNGRSCSSRTRGEPKESAKRRKGATMILRRQNSFLFATLLNCFLCTYNVRQPSSCCTYMYNHYSYMETWYSCTYNPLCTTTRYRATPWILVCGCERVGNAVPARPGDTVCEDLRLLWRDNSTGDLSYDSMIRTEQQRDCLQPLRLASTGLRLA